MDTAKSTPLQRIQRVSRWVRSVYMSLIAVHVFIVIAYLIVFFTESGGFLVKDNFLNFRVS